MSRGIVGDRGGRATVQSPIKKQAFALDDGSCLDDPDRALPVYETRITPGGVRPARVLIPRRNRIPRGVLRGFSRADRNLGVI